MVDIDSYNQLAYGTEEYIVIKIAIWIKILGGLILY